MKYSKKEEAMLSRRLDKIMKDDYTYVVFAYDPKTKRFTYKDTCSTLDIAKKKLNKYANLRVPAIKVVRSRGSKYNAVYLLEHNSNVIPVYTLYRATEAINALYKTEYHTKTRKADKEVDCGYMGFAYNNKTGSYVCTRLYDDSSDVKNHINKRHGVDKTSLEILDVIRIKAGFKFINKKFDNCNRIKQVKAAMLEDAKATAEEIIQAKLDVKSSKEVMEEEIANYTEEEVAKVLSDLRKNRED